jgi:sortase A
MNGMATTAEAPAPAVKMRGDGWRMVVRGIGQFLITAGIVILLFVVYELWVTGLYTKQWQSSHLKKLEQSWAPGHHSIEISKADPKIAQIPLGSGIAVLYIPRFGKGYHMVIVEGTGTSDLEKGPGHYPGTAFPGQVGNFAVAGHRTTYLHPFYHLDALRRGDAIVLETKTMWFTYRIEDSPPTKGYPHVPYQEIVNPTDVSVAYPVPDQSNPDAKPSLKMLTFTSCNPRYSAAQRIVVHAVLAEALPRGPGVVPPALGG